MHLWFKGVEIFRQKESVTRELQECWPLTFRLKYQYLASFPRLSFEYEVRSLIIAKIPRYCTGKNAPFLSHSDLDLQNIGPFLYRSIRFKIMYQYQYVVQSDRLNNGTIGTVLRKGICISMTHFLYRSIRFTIMYQYQYVVQSDRLNNGTIGTVLRKGICISMTHCEGTTTGIERKYRQL